MYIRSCRLNAATPLILTVMSKEKQKTTDSSSKLADSQKIKT